MIRSCVKIAGYELRRIFTDRDVIPVMLLAVVVYFFLYPQPYLTEIPRNLPVAVVDMDNSARSRDLIRRIDTSDGATAVTGFSSLAQAQRAFLARQNFAIVLIPLYFEKNLRSGQPSSIVMYGDGSYFLPYNQLVAMLQGIANQMVKEAVVERGLVTGGGTPFQLTLMPLFNPLAGYATYIFPIAFTLIMQQTLLMGVGLLGAGCFPTEPERLILQRFTPPISILILLVGKVLGYLLLYSQVFLLYTLVMPYFYDLPRLGTIWTLCAVGLPYLLAICCLGMVIAAVMPNRHSVLLLLFPLGIPILFISGAPWPTESIPSFVRYISYIFPTTFGIKALVSVNQVGADLNLVKNELIGLWGQVLVYGSIAAVLYRIKLRQV